MTLIDLLVRVSDDTHRAWRKGIAILVDEGKLFEKRIKEGNDRGNKSKRVKFSSKVKTIRKKANPRLNVSKRSQKRFSDR